MSESKTPRTDAETAHYGGLDRVSASFARELELELSESVSRCDIQQRELIAARARFEEQEGNMFMLRVRIEKLQEALAAGKDGAT